MQAHVHPAFVQAEIARRQARHLVDGLLQAEQVLLAPIAGQHPRKGAPQARMRMPVVRQAVGTDDAARVADDAAHVVFMHLEIAGASGLEAQAGLALRGAPFRRDGLQMQTHGGPKDVVTGAEISSIDGPTSAGDNAAPDVSQPTSVPSCSQTPHQ